MVIQIRGTSGSGKSTLVRRIMDLYSVKVRDWVDGRPQPIGYHLSQRVGGQALFVVGHYETATGGCDTISEMDEVYRWVRRAAAAGWHVLFEGIMASGERNRAIELHKNFDFKIRGDRFVSIALTTPIDTCIASVNQRRAARGEMEPVDPSRTIRRQLEVARMMEHLQKAGIETEWFDREDAFIHVRRLLGV